MYTLNIVTEGIVPPPYVNMVGVTEENTPFPNFRSLVPAPDLMQKWADGYDIRREYYAQLDSYEELSISIFYCMLYIPVCIYMSKQDLDVYGNMLIEYISNNYNIIPGIISYPIVTQYIEQPMAHAHIPCKLIQHGYIGVDDFIRLYPAGLEIPASIIPILVRKLPEQTMSLEEYYKYFNRLNKEKMAGKVVMASDSIHEQY